MRTLMTLIAQYPLVSGVTALALVCLLSPYLLGAALIRERQVGIVIKKFGTRSLPPRRLFALAGEAGYQADTLAPGLHFGYYRWQYRILKTSVTVVPQEG
jgi:uncharacterized membrane protein YqiK